jgi:hypothetical protein
MCQHVLPRPKGLLFRELPDHPINLPIQRAVPARGAKGASEGLGGPSVQKLVIIGFKKGDPKTKTKYPAAATATADVAAAPPRRRPRLAPLPLATLPQARFSPLPLHRGVRTEPPAGTA